jgi:hypothetical protein
MKIKNKIEEKKLTKAELEAREKVMKDLKKNKSALVKRYGKDAEAVMYGRATNIAKKMAESENKNRLKELVRKALTKEADIEVDADRYEGEKELGQASIMMDKLEQGLKTNDWWYFMADYINPEREAQNDNLLKLVKQLDAMGYGKDAKALYNQYAPEQLALKEGKKEDVDGDGDIDSKDYLAKRDAAIKKAKGEVDEADMQYVNQQREKLRKATDAFEKKKRLRALQQKSAQDKIEPLMREDIDLGHEDNEPHMIKAELYRIGKYAMELYAMAEELEETGQEIDFPAWWQAMITDAAAKMVKAKHYLDFELKEPAIDAAVDALTGEKPHMGEPEPSMMGDLDEGFFDRVKAGVKGAVAGVGQAAKNVGAAVKGDASQFVKTSDVVSGTKLAQKTKTLGKELDDAIKDLNIMFPKEKLSKDPKLKDTIEKYIALLNQTKTASASIAAIKPTTGASTTPARDEKGRFTKKVAENVAEKLTKQLKSK